MTRGIHEPMKMVISKCLYLQNTDKISAAHKTMSEVQADFFLKNLVTCENYSSVDMNFSKRYSDIISYTNRNINRGGLYGER